ncbi:MAG TPA: serine hydrolase domain-containing protein [Gaiellaceae bacterium]|nr:serine hydrolase domain-containing protein [Gaiellaceae bacterium]
MLDGALAAACEQALARWKVPGAAIGVLADGQTAIQGFGVLDVRTGEPVTAESTFRIASITKPFTATLALYLSLSGLLSLDEDVPGPVEGLTPQHLLSHLGGFEGECGDLARFGEGDDALPRLVAELAAQPQIVPLDEVWSYCNAGFWLLGQFLADRAGSTYEQTLTDWVVNPLGLSRTGFGAPEATGHEPIEPGSTVDEPVTAAYPRARNASGGLVSNVGDLLAFARFHLESAETEILRRPVVDTPTGDYGFGFALERVGELELWGHTGDYGGFRSLLVLEPGSGLAFAGLVNSERGSSALEEILDAVLENAVGVRRVPPETVPLPAAELELLAGRYGHSELELELHADGDWLAVDAVEIGRGTGIRTPQPPLRARSLGGRLFAFEGDGWERARFDFHPRDGAPRFVRFGSRLAERR